MNNDREQLARMMQQTGAIAEKIAEKIAADAAKLAGAATAEEDDIERARRFRRSVASMLDDRPFGFVAAAEQVDFDHEDLPPREPPREPPRLELEKRETWATVELPEELAAIIEAAAEASTAAADESGRLPRELRIARFVREALAQAAFNPWLALSMIPSAHASAAASQLRHRSWCAECGADLFGYCAENSICAACAEELAE